MAARPPFSRQRAAMADYSRPRRSGPAFHSPPRHIRLGTIGPRGGRRVDCMAADALSEENSQRCRLIATCTFLKSAT
jgi:hypothetical protein